MTSTTSSTGSTIRPVPEPRDGGRSQAQTQTGGGAQLIPLSWHGTCPRCKHFHINRPIEVCPANEAHARVRCAICRHHILGIGRTETQDSLVSVNSFPVIDGRPIPPSDQTPFCIDAPSPAEVAENITNASRTSSTDHLQDAESATANSYISAVSRTTGNMPAGLMLLRRNPGFSYVYKRVANLVTSVFECFGVSHFLPASERASTPLLAAKSTELSVLGYRFCFQLLPPTKGSGVTGRKSGGFQDMGSGPVGLTSRHHLMAATVRNGPQIGSSRRAFTSPPVTQEERPMAADEGDPAYRSQRRARLRSEKTLKRSAMTKMGCQCSPQCACRSSNSRHSTSPMRSDSVRSATPPTSDVVPSHSLFQNLGFHPSLQTRYSDSTNSSNPPTNSLSQASTLRNDSEGSSISLHPGRPQPGGLPVRGVPGVNRRIDPILQTILNDPSHFSPDEPENMNDAVGFDPRLPRISTDSLSSGRGISGSEVAFDGDSHGGFHQLSQPSLETLAHHLSQDDDTTPTNATSANTPYRSESDPAKSHTTLEFEETAIPARSSSDPAPNVNGTDSAG